MSFESRDLMIDLLPTGKFNALVQPGFALCGQITSADEEEEEEEDDLDCGQITSGNAPAYAPRTGTDLALLRRQLRETLTLEDGPR
ncbi:MAG: hypothetical protein DMF53_18100 [Acidobacteria bacterium]|nr:MAG: hypothetical protein DMF53_18100 [Acidobacteriota bacterium]